MGTGEAPLHPYLHVFCHAGTVLCHLGECTALELVDLVLAGVAIQEGMQSLTLLMLLFAGSSASRSSLSLYRSGYALWQLPLSTSDLLKMSYNL